MLTKDASVSTPDTACGALLPDPCVPLSDKWEGSVMEHFSSWAKRDPERVCEARGVYHHKYAICFLGIYPRVYKPL